MQTTSATHKIQSIVTAYAHWDIPHPKLHLAQQPVGLDRGLDPTAVPTLVPLDSRSAVVQLSHGCDLQHECTVGSLHRPLLTTALARRLCTTAAGKMTS